LVRRNNFETFEGEKAILTIQPDYGYGNRDVGNGLIPANSVLVIFTFLMDKIFEVELLKILG
jgi:FKBP-type peptidyl-prolyl cis-trans isomerase